MRKVPLSELCNLITDGTHHTPKYTEDGIPFLRVTDLTGSSDSKKFISKEEHETLIKRCFPEKEDILYTKNGTIGVAKKITWDYQFSIFVSLCLLKPKKELIIVDYLVHYLNTSFALAQATKHTKTGTISNLHLNEIKKIQIPLPPLVEQQRIADLLDAADALRQKDKALLEKYEDLGQSLFLELFGDPVENNLHFDFQKFESICKVSQGMQIAISQRHSSPGPNRYKYLTVAYLNGRKDAEYIENPRNSVVCSKDDILMTRTGNTGQVITNVEGVFHNNFFKIDWDQKKLNKTFLVSLLSQNRMRTELLKRASTTTIPDLSHSQFYDINCLLPNISLQNHFASQMELIEQQKEKVKANLEKSEELFQGLLGESFK